MTQPMPLSEFALIDQYFRSLCQPRHDVVMGIGDDAAVVQPAAQTQLVVTTDTMVEGNAFSARCASRRYWL
jgi:thiamine-monophosphate kinase